MFWKNLERIYIQIYIKNIQLNCPSCGDVDKFLFRMLEETQACSILRQTAGKALIYYEIHGWEPALCW